MHDADEFHQHPITGGLDHSAPVLGDFGVDKFLAMGLELAKRAFLVSAHQSAIASDVAGKNRGKPTIDAAFRHIVVPENQTVIVKVACGHPEVRGRPA